MRVGSEHEGGGDMGCEWGGEQEGGGDMGASRQ